MSSLVTLRRQLKESERAWQRFHEWETAEPRVDRDAARIIADLGTILDWIPLEIRLADPDPEKIGVRKMLAALGRLSGPQNAP